MEGKSEDERDAMLANLDGTTAAAEAEALKLLADHQAALAGG
jgi:hypothetical protein